MLELYQLEECPFCAKVRRKMGELGLDYLARAVPRDRALRDKVEEVSGQRGVPVLVDTDRDETVFDSDRIVEYLERNYGS